MNLLDATSKLAQLHPRLSEKEIDVVHRAGIKHQAADALSYLATTGEDWNSIDDALLVMAVSSPPKDETKGRIKANDVIEDCNNTGPNTTSLILSAVCLTTTPRVDTTTPTLTELLFERVRDAFFRQVAGKIGTPG